MLSCLTADLISLSSAQISHDGQYQLAAIQGSSELYVSKDFGHSWNPANNSPPVAAWWFLAVTATGNPMFAATLTEAWISINYGEHWLSLSSGIFQSTSAYGQVQAAANRTNGSIITDYAPLLISQDTGATWTVATNGSVGNFGSIAISATGSYITATIAPGVNHLYTSVDSGSTWNVTAPADRFQDVAVSSTGQYQTAVALYGSIYTSSDYGKTFAPVAGTGTQAWVAVAVSCSGVFQVAVAKENGSIWASDDYGRTWNVPAGAPKGSNYWDVAISCSGQYITVANGAEDAVGLVGSSDFGNSWSVQGQGYDWSVVAMNQYPASA